jgi:hypothetical protein
MDPFHLSQDFVSGDSFIDLRVPLQIGSGKLAPHFGVQGF